MRNKKNLIGIIGLGYVGLPLALTFATKYETIGFDVNKSRIKNLSKGIDTTCEVSKNDLKKSKLLFTTDSSHLKDCNFYIITVPTPIYNNKEPDLSFLKKASQIVSKLLSKNDIVIYESTVFPGATENYCVPILEQYSKLKYNIDFFCGYSPERINPGDKQHRINEIKKVTSGSNAKVRKIVDKLYSSIITAGTYSAESIIVAEAAKVIENTQRDVNIALINELSVLFNKMKIDTNQVLKAAGTKWNFLKFTPGLVGGHCIGVDPYYLTYIAKKNGYTPKIILSGRKINDEMFSFIFKSIMKLIPYHKRKSGLDILIYGITFKENCPDIRNSQTLKLIKKFNQIGCQVNVLDPYIDHNLAIKDINFKIVDGLKKKKYDILIGAVAHDEFKKLSLKFHRKFIKQTTIVYDIKNFLPQKLVTNSL